MAVTAKTYVATFCLVARLEVHVDLAPAPQANCSWVLRRSSTLFMHSALLRSPGCGASGSEIGDGRVNFSRWNKWHGDAFGPMDISELTC